METHARRKSSIKYGERDTHTFLHNGNMSKYGENDGRISYLIVSTRGVIVKSDLEERMMKVKE